MSASLFGERFIGRREPAWHRLGEVFQQDLQLTATEAMEKADIMFRVDKYPLVAQMPDGTSIETNTFGVVREPTKDSNKYELFGTVGSQWTPIQADELGRILDPISKQYPIETAGAIGKGEKIFLTMDAGESKIAGEDHHLYYLVTDHRTGLGALTFAFTPVRIVCQNTLTVGLNDATVSTKLEHNRNIVADSEWYADIFERMLNAKEATVSAMNSLTSVNITDEEAMKVIMAGYPNPSRPARVKIQDNLPADVLSKDDYLRMLNDNKHHVNKYEDALKRQERIRDHALELYDVFNQQHGNLSRTPWAIWQAVVETEDYRRGRDASMNILVGDRAMNKSRAFSKALELVG